MTQQYHLASKAAPLSSTGISYHDLFPHLPSIHLSAVNSSPHPEIYLCCPNSQLLCLPGHPHPCLGYAWLWQGLTDSHSIQAATVSCFTLSLQCFSSDSDNCPDVGIRPLLLFPHPLRAGPILLTLQARILEWGAFSFFKEYSQPRDQTQVSHIAGGFFTS